jgi:hypothetical protein
MPSLALLKMGPEEDEDGVEVEFSELGVLSFEGSLERDGGEFGLWLGGDDVGQNLTCTRGKVASNNREVPGLSIQIIETL